jgi:hypothetical protein
MTTSTIDARPAVTHSGANRIAAVVRLQFTNPWTVLILPWLILIGILLLNMAIWWLIFSNVQSPADLADARDGTQYSGAVAYAFVYMMVVAVQAISGYFPFALGYGVTRRNYYLGAAISFVLLSVFYSIGLSLFALVEQATNGWGVGGTMFTAVYFGDSWVQRLFIFFTILMFFFFIGSAVAAVYVRWKATGMIVFFASLALLVIGGLALVSLTQNWAAVGAWFIANGFVGTFAWTLVPTTIAAITGYFILRKATPKN